MAYEATATRRRPQRFEDLAGQEFVAATLKNAIQLGKIAPAYLFSGPRGCGKTSSARILAKALNCEKGPAAVPCGVCSACCEITRGSSLDVIEIDGASNTSVNDIRQIKDEILFPPNACRYKIYIIDEVHMLSVSAFNALLKTIEEPPPYVVFIFATTELHKVPATIKSRCQQFHFRLVSVGQIKDLLGCAAGEAGIAADDEALYWIARESTGSIRDAYTLFDQVAAFSEGHITYEKIKDTLGLLGVDEMNEFCELCAAGDTGSALQKLDQILQKGISIEQFISDCTEYMRTLLLISAGVRRDSLLGQSAERYSQKVLDVWRPLQLERGISLFLDLYRDIRYSLDPRYETELAVSRLCWLKSYVSAGEVKAAVEAAGAALAGYGQPPRLGETAPASEDPLFPLPSRTIPAAGEGSSRPFAEGGFFKKPPVLRPNGNSVPFGEKGEGGKPLPAGSADRETHSAVPAAGSGIDISDLKNAAAEELIGRGDTSLAMLLSGTEGWEISGDTIRASAASAFACSQLKREVPRISALLSSMLGKTVAFVPAVLEQKPAPRPAEKKNSLQVEILCNLFKGTVTGGGQ